MNLIKNPVFWASLTLICCNYGAQAEAHVLYGKSLTLPETVAKAFLHERNRRQTVGDVNRNVMEECREGCLWEEVREIKLTYEATREYMRYWKCRYPMQQCSNGYYCAFTNDIYTHIANLGMECRRNWDNWSEFSNCSVPCELGEKTRYRDCATADLGRTCFGTDVDIQTCNTGIPCPIHGNWSNWSEPSNCSVACGTGITTRIRACDNPAPQNGGDLCPGSDREQQECDSGVPCPAVNGGWGYWSNWSDCNVTCGVGMKQKTRPCDSPPPSDDGLPCVGLEKETTPCLTLLPCPAPPCPHGVLVCADMKTCYNPNNICDGTSQCPSGEDEVDCQSVGTTLGISGFLAWIVYLVVIMNI